MTFMNITDRKISPPVRPFLPFELEKPSVDYLSNGLPVYFFANDHLNLIHFALRVRAGSLFEKHKFTANCAYNLLMESAKGCSSCDVEDFLDYYGSNFNVGVSLEYITINFIIPKANCGKVIPFIYDFLTHPEYKEENLSYYKQRRIKDLEYNMLKVGYRSQQWMNHLLINPDIPAGKMLTREDIENVNIGQITAYHHDTLCAENLSLYIAGNLGQEELSQIRDVFSRIPGKRSSVLPDLIPSNNTKGELVLEKWPDSVQSSLVIARRLFGYRHQDRRDFNVLSTILGGYFGSRLMQNLREKNGYTYGVYNYFNYFADESIFYIETDVNVERTGDALSACKEEMVKLMENAVGDEELHNVKNYMTGSLLRRLDGSVDYMKTYMLWNASGIDEKELAAMMDTIRRITPERIRELAVGYLNPDDFVTIVVGDIPGRDTKD